MNYMPTTDLLIKFYLVWDLAQQSASFNKENKSFTSQLPITIWYDGTASSAAPVLKYSLHHKRCIVYNVETHEIWVELFRWKNWYILIKGFFFMNTCESYSSTCVPRPVSNLWWLCSIIIMCNCLQQKPLRIHYVPLMILCFISIYDCQSQNPSEGSLMIMFLL